MSSDGGLSALRAALMAGRPVTLREGGKLLDIDGEAFPADGETAFRIRKNGTRKYKLVPLWLQWTHRDNSKYLDLSAATRALGFDYGDIVLASDKPEVVEYLAGRSTAPNHVDAAGGAGAGVSGSGAAASIPEASASAVAAICAADEQPSADVFARREMALRSRNAVLDAPGKANLRDYVFAKFEQVNAAAGGSTAVAASASTTTSAAGVKRQRAAVGGGALEDKLASFRGTPVIVVPAAVTSLISLRNVAELLEQGRFVPPAEARAAAVAAAVAAGGDELRLPRIVDVRRRDATTGVERTFHVIDDVSLLKERADWLRVVAVFAHGPDWQFKGWRWGREDARRPDITPTEIFDRCVGFHVMYDGDVPHPNVPKWNVKVLRVSKSTRHADATASNAFWQAVEKDMQLRKAYLTPK